MSTALIPGGDSPLPLCRFCGLLPAVSTDEFGRCSDCRDRAHNVGRHRPRTTVTDFDVFNYEKQRAED